MYLIRFRELASRKTTLDSCARLGIGKVQHGSIPGQEGTWRGPGLSHMELCGPAKRDLLQSFLKLENGIPSHDTFSRALRFLGAGDAGAGGFSAVVPGVQGTVCGRHCGCGGTGVVALDGKTLRRSCDRAQGQSALHLGRAWAEERRLVLGPVAVDDKSKEIAPAPRLLSLRGKVVTAGTPPRSGRWAARPARGWCRRTPPASG